MGQAADRDTVLSVPCIARIRALRGVGELPKSRSRRLQVTLRPMDRSIYWLLANRYFRSSSNIRAAPLYRRDVVHLPKGPRGLSKMRGTVGLLDFQQLS